MLVEAVFVKLQESKSAVVADSPLEVRDVHWSQRVAKSGSQKQ